MERFKVYYYEWGDEPCGMYTVFYYNSNDEVVNIGFKHKDECKGMEFLNPHS